MYCAQCGTNNPDGGDTCSVCGSPLTPRSGPERCQACDSPVSAFDRYCQHCGATLTQVPESEYTPGPSFTDDEEFDVDTGELPPWLRDLAQVKSEVSEPAPAEPALGDERLPEWLRAVHVSEGEAPEAEPSPVAPETARAKNGVSAENFSLIGEDDLPEWLRALGDEETPVRSGPDILTGAPASTPAAVTQVPSVSRAWLARPRAVDADALAAARREFVPLDAEATTAPETIHVEASPVAPAVAVAEPPVAPVAAGPAEARKRRIRIYILVIALIVLALLLYIWLGGAR